MTAAATRRASSLDHALAPIVPALLACAGACCLAGFARAVAIAPLHIPLDPDEGWNAYHAVAAMAGRGLYPGAPNLMVNNYPPLSFYLVGCLGRLTGDQILAGRIVSLVSFLFACGFAALSLRRLGIRWQPAAYAALLLAATLLLTSGYVGMDDPQMLGHALQLVALFAILREPRRAGATLLAAGLFTAGGLVKHNLFALPLASLLWLALVDRRNALRLAIAMALLSLLALLSFRALSGIDLLGRLLSARSWSFAQLFEGLLAWLPAGAVPLCALVAVTWWCRTGRAARFAAIYAAIAVATGALLAGGAGVDINAFFDADIALALASGMALDKLLKRRPPLLHIAGRGLALATFLPLVVLAFDESDWRESAFWTEPLREESALAAHDIAFLREHPGRDVCETLAFCYWAGKRDPVDVFNLDQQIVNRVRDPSTLLRLIEARSFAAMEFDETTPFPLPASLHAAILRNYKIDHADDNGVFFVPR